MRIKTLITSVATLLCCWLLNDDANGQTAVWEQKFEILEASCEPNGSGPRITEFTIGSDGNLYFSDPGSLYRSTDGGSTWELSQFNLVHTEGTVPLSAGNLLIGLYGDGGIYHIADSGDTWSQTSVTENVWGLVATDDLSHIFARAAGVGLYVSTDQGETWVLTQAEWDVSAIRVGPSGRTYLLAEDIYVSDDGFTWTQLLTSRFPFPSGTPGILLSDDSEGVYRSVDNGQTWDLTLSLSEPALLRNNDDVIVAVSRDGDVHVSSDDGLTWSPMITSSPLPCGVRSVVSVDGDGHLWLGSDVGVIFRSSQTTHVAAENSLEVPAAVSLSVYPNPTNTSANFVFRQERPGQARLRIFNVIGREVHSYVTELQGVAETHVAWNTTGVPAGVYFARLESSGVVTIQSVTVTN